MFRQSPNVLGSLIPVPPTWQGNRDTCSVSSSLISSLSLLSWLKHAKLRRLGPKVSQSRLYPFSSFSHTQFFINTVSRIPEHDVEGLQPPFLKNINLIHSIMRPIHFSRISLFLASSISLLLCVLLLALWISKCSIWFPPSLIIEATVIQDLPPSAPSVPDPCFSSFLGNRLHIVRHQ